MLKHRELYDPVTRTDEMEVKEFTKYVDICNSQVGPTPPDLVAEIKNQFYDYRKYHGREVLDPVWNEVEPYLTKNAGLAQFTLDYDGAISDFFFPWLKSIHTSPSMALEMAYGEGYDIRGRWRPVGDDEIDYFVRNDPTFVYNRERQLFVANLATTVREIRPYGTNAKIVDLGAGRMAWARWHGFECLPAVQKIFAFDTDQTINPDALFKYDCADFGVTYKKLDFMKALTNTACQDASLVILGGVASYYPTEIFESMIVTPVYHLLREGGAFFFDLQLDCPYYRRSVKIFNWPEMKLAESATVAIDGLEAMRKRLWRAGMKFDAEYKLDAYNEIPTSVMVVLTKL